MRLADALKKKRDEEERVRISSALPTFTEDADTGDSSYNAALEAQSDIDAHVADTANPHGVTAAQAGAAASDHNHDAAYSATDHNHDTAYLKKQSGSLPTAAVDYRGQLWTVEGGAGVADIIYCCIKNVSDTYEWIAIS